MKSPKKPTVSKKNLKEFFRGVGSVFNIWGEIPTRQNTPLQQRYSFTSSDPAAREEAIAQSIRSSWEKVGQDMRTAIDRFAKQHNLEA